VLDYAQRRADVRRAEELATLAHNENGDYTAERARLARSLLTDGGGELGLMSAEKAAQVAYDEVMYNAEHPLGPGEIRDLSTGLVDLDGITGGLHPGLYAVAGCTHSGKTALALQIAVNAASNGQRALFLSPEMSPGELMHRAVCAAARVTSREVESGHLSPEQLGRVTNAFGWLSEMALSISQETHIAKVEALVYQALPLDLVVIDGVKLLKGARSERTHEAKGELTRWAKGLAENPDVKCPVWLSMQISAHQLKHRDDKRPRPGDVYASGEPEMDADNVLLLHRERYWNPDHFVNSVEVGYWKSRKRGRELPASCELLLDQHGAVRDLAKREPPEPYFGGG